MRKRAEKIAKILGHTPAEWQFWDSWIKDIEAELTAAVREERKKWEAEGRRAIMLLKRYRDKVSPDTATAGAIPEDVLVTKSIDALAALLTEEK